MFGFALFAFQTFQQGTELFDFPAQREHPHLFVAQSALQVFELAEYVAQFAFHGERAFRALFAACNRHVMETFASLRQEECVGVFESQTARGIRSGNDVTVAQLRKNHFQRLSKAIENADGIFQGHDRSRGRRAVRGFVKDERRTWPASLRDEPETWRGRQHRCAAGAGLRRQRPRT